MYTKHNWPQVGPCAPQLHFPWLNVFPERVPYALAVRLSQLPSSGVSGAGFTDTVWRETSPAGKDEEQGKKERKNKIKTSTMNQISASTEILIQGMLLAREKKS